MLVMEFMDHGSLHDLLHNETLLLDGDLVLPILRDIAQGLRFLHAANPTVIHVSATVHFGYIMPHPFHPSLLSFFLSPGGPESC